MKNYITTSNELDIICRRLKRLYARREKVQAALTNTTGKLKDVVVSGGTNNDKIGNYIAELDEITVEIKELEEESAILKDDLDYMENRLSNINEIKEQVFTRYFIKGEKPLEIAPKIPCGKTTVYRYINEINAERASWEKNGKKLYYNSKCRIVFY